jgi:hypothetical protein
MIVGIRIVSHATIICHTQMSSKVGGSVQILVIDIVTSGVTALMPRETALDVGIDDSSSNSSESIAILSQSEIKLLLFNIVEFVSNDFLVALSTRHSWMRSVNGKFK